MRCGSPAFVLPQGFSATVNAIVQNLPVERQTLLFSATQTKSVRLSASEQTADAAGARCRLSVPG